MTIWKRTWDEDERTLDWFQKHHNEFTDHTTQREFDPRTKCVHGRLVIEGQCLKCLFGDWDECKPEELR